MNFNKWVNTLLNCNLKNVKWNLSLANCIKTVPQSLTKHKNQSLLYHVKFAIINKHKNMNNISTIKHEDYQPVNLHQANDKHEYADPNNIVAVSHRCPGDNQLPVSLLPLPLREQETMSTETMTMPVMTFHWPHRALVCLNMDVLLLLFFF